MDLIRPVYYDRFTCLAAHCPDSCCRMWDVQVDEASAERYLLLSGPLGDTLRHVLKKDAEGYYLEQKNGRCPMWQEDGLCRIQRELGEDALCHVCSSFPRLRHEYSGLTELGLELSCPEAARLILQEESGELLCRHLPHDESSLTGSDELSLLRRSRQKALSLLMPSAYGVGESLALLLLYAHQVQAALDGGEEAAFAPEEALKSAKDFAFGGEFAKLLRFYQRLEILTPQWRARLNAPSACLPWQKEHLALARYFVLRYWLQAVSDYDLVGRVKFILLSCLMIRGLGGELCATAQLYSKEIENDQDNVDALLDAAYEEKAFTDAAILDLLLNH